MLYPTQIMVCFILQLEHNKISNNLIIQWGACLKNTSKTNEIWGTCTFPMSYNTIFNVIATCNDASDIINVYNLTTTSFQYAILERYSQYTVFENFYWFAIGT